MEPRARLLRRASMALAALYLAASVVVGIALAEYTLRVHRRPISHRSEFMEAVQRQWGSDLRDVSIVAADGAQLRAWVVRPASGNGSTVILLHGVTDNREGVAGFAGMFLDAGYGVLVPDSRAHGESGGQIATYGLLEREDLHRWAEWARGDSGGRCVYLFGESMGAAISLQALAADHQLCAVVVESPYSTFREIAYDRFARHSGLPLTAVRVVGTPALESALLYARLRYGVTLSQSSPALCINGSPTPVLLIAGTADRNIPERHAKLLHGMAASHTELWEVRGADHGGAVSVAPVEFQHRVLGWFQQNGRR